MKVYPSTRVPLTVDGVTWVIIVGVALKLPYPIILGLDWTEFTRILHTTSLWDLPEQMALEGDPLEGRLRYEGRLTQATHQPHVGVSALQPSQTTGKPP